MAEIPGQKTMRLPLLDGLRGIAAIAVVFHHEPGLYRSQGLFPRAYLAVDFFFMLSGFVLTLAYERRLQDSLSPAAFMRLRIARLWPLLAVGILIAGLGAFAFDCTIRPLVLMALSLALVPVISGYGYGGIYQLDGPQWSVSFELIANYAHARLLRRLSDDALLALALVCGVVLALQGWHWGSLASGDMVHNWWGGFARVGFSYIIGVWLGRQFRAGRGRIDLGKHWWLAALPVPAILLLAPLLPLSPFVGDSLAVFLLLPPALWLAAQANPSKAASPMLDWLGRSSYPIYAIHIPVLALVAHHTYGLPPGQQTLIRIAAIATTFALASALAISPLAKGQWRRRTTPSRITTTG